MPLYDSKTKWRSGRGSDLLKFISQFLSAACSLPLPFLTLSERHVLHFENSFFTDYQGLWPQLAISLGVHGRYTAKTINRGLLLPQLKP